MCVCVYTYRYTYLYTCKNKHTHMYQKSWLLTDNINSNLSHGVFPCLPKFYICISLFPKIHIEFQNCFTNTTKIRKLLLEVFCTLFSYLIGTKGQAVKSKVTRIKLYFPPFSISPFNLLMLFICKQLCSLVYICFSFSFLFTSYLFKFFKYIDINLHLKVKTMQKGICREVSRAPLFLLLHTPSMCTSLAFLCFLFNK